MRFICLGLASLIDVLVNLAIFSGKWAGEFSVTEIAQFSGWLGFVTVAVAVLYGGVEAVIDHKRFIFVSRIFSVRNISWAAVLASFVSLVFIIDGNFWAGVWIPLLIALQGMRNVGRAANYIASKYTIEVFVSAVEFICIFIALFYGVGVVVGYVYARIVGVLMRARVISETPVGNISKSEKIGYTVSAITPALYFNLYHASLPFLVKPDVVVSYRVIQTLLVPVSFFGSLVSRAKILFHRDCPVGVATKQSPSGLSEIFRTVLKCLAPFALSALYTLSLCYFKHAFEFSVAILCALYSGLIYHRACMYALITLKVGAKARAKIGMFGVFLIALSLIPYFLNVSPSLFVVFGLLCVVEVVLVIISLLTIRVRF